MASNSDYIICTVRMQKLHTVKDYREFAEMVAARFGYRLIRFGAVARKDCKPFFGQYKNRQYSKAKQTYFDEASVSELCELGFYATNVKRSFVANFFLRFSFRYDAGLDYIHLVLDSETGSEGPRSRQTECFIDMLSDVSDIRLVQSDRMDSDKWVDAFASGVCHRNRRNDFENTVAYNISFSKRFHQKPPFLFAHNLVKMDASMIVDVPEHVSLEEDGEYVTIAFPRCEGRELDEYPALPEWLSVYEALRGHGIIQVDDKLAGMVAEAAPPLRSGGGQEPGGGQGQL